MPAIAGFTHLTLSDRNVIEQGIHLLTSDEVIVKPVLIAPFREG